MSIGSGYLQRVDLHVLNVVGPTRILEVHLEFTRLLARLRKSGRAFRLLFDLTNAQLQGDRQHLRYFLTMLEKHTLRKTVSGDAICMIVVERCPLCKDLATMSDIFHSKLALLEQRHSAFVVTRDRNTAIRTLESISIAGA